MDPNMRPRTIYDDLQGNQNPMQPPQINVNIGGYNSQGNNIYSAVQPNIVVNPPQVGGNIYSQASGNIYAQPDNNIGLAPQVGGIYAQPDSNPGLAPQISGNIYPPPENNPEIAPQIGGNIYVPPQIPEIPPQNNENAYVPPEISPGLPPQNDENNFIPPPMKIELPEIDNTNVFVPPENNLPPINPPISAQITSGYGPQTGEGLAIPTTTISPMNLNSASSEVPPTQAPLIPNDNVIVYEGNCCTREDASMTELKSCSRVTIRFMALVLAFSVIINFIANLTIGSRYFGIILSIDAAFLLYAIFLCISVKRIKWLRVAATVLSIFFLIGGIGGSVLQYILLQMDNNHSSFNDGAIRFCGFITIVRIICIIAILIAIFQFYWGYECCKSRGSSGIIGSSNYDTSTYYETGGSTTYHHNIHITTRHRSPPRIHARIHHSPPHHRPVHRSPPRHIAPHHAPHHSAPHHSAPHHSAPHHSAPHHAPHRSAAPHHAPHHSAHHGGGHHGGGHHGGGHGGRRH